INRAELDPASLRVELIGEMNEGSFPIRLDSFRSLLDRGCLKYDGVTVPRHDALRSIAEADYLLLLDVQDSSAGSQAPAKLFDYLRIGRPILAFTPRGSASDHILARSGIPHTSVYVDDTVECIDRKVADFLSLGSEPVSASAWFYENFDGIQ